MKLKRLSPEGIVAALEKAMRYRLLNEPGEAESICLDVLEVDPENETALTTLILAISDQFGSGVPMRNAQELIPRLNDEYDRAYYGGIIHERMAKAAIRRFTPARLDDAHDLLRRAMELFEEAERLRPAGNDDAILRWNTCFRWIERYNLEPRQKDPVGPELE